MQQQEQPEPQTTVEVDEAEAVQEEPSQSDEPTAQETQDIAVSDDGEIDFGHRIGLPFVRNSFGDPDAPVVIIEYSDFQ